MKVQLATAAPKDAATLQVTQEKDTLFLEFTTAHEHIRQEAGAPKQLTRRKFVLLMRRMVRLVQGHKVKHLAIHWDTVPLAEAGLSSAEALELAVTNWLMADYDFVAYKTTPEQGWPVLESLTVVTRSTSGLKQPVVRGQAIGEAVNFCRDLSNTPPAVMTPAHFADTVKAAAEGLPHTTVDILGRKELEAMQAGGILAVGNGSAQEPKLVVVEYKGADEPPIALVGKGVMFDSGGLNLKPTDHIYSMHLDMSGGAAVMSTILLAARLELKKHLVAIVPAVENMPSGSSYHPGDLVKTMSGLTIEVFNTDAEGRVILADALTYAKQFKPRLTVDVATLTGAAMVALGTHTSAVFTPDESRHAALRELGERSGDYVWPMPVWEEYEDDIRGTFGDWANTGRDRYGGAVHAAVFLKQFTPDPANWIHLDIAPRMLTNNYEALAYGAAGAPVRLLIKLAEEFS